MHAQRFFCIGASILFSASLLLVATDELVSPGAEHQPGDCPVCSWASCLATSTLPPPPDWTAEWTVDRAPREPVHIRVTRFARPLLRSRAPPESLHG